MRTVERGFYTRFEGQRVGKYCRYNSSG